MKKLAVIQIVLGLMLIGSLVFWSLRIFDGYLTFEGTVIGTDKSVAEYSGQEDYRVTVFSNPGTARLTAAWQIVYFLLGMLVAGFGIARYVTIRRGERAETGGNSENRLAIVQMVLGVLIVASLVWFIGWVEFDYGSYPRTHYNIWIELSHAPDWYVMLVSWKVISFILGLTVAGLGTIQLIKARKGRRIN